MLIDLNMNPSPQGGSIVAQDRSFLKPRRFFASCIRSLGMCSLLIPVERTTSFFSAYRGSILEKGNSDFIRYRRGLGASACSGLL